MLHTLITSVNYFFTLRAWIRSMGTSVYTYDMYM